MSEITHRYAAPFLAACGISGKMRVHSDAAKVTCEACKAQPDDPAARADYDQLVAHLRAIQEAAR